MSWQQDAPLIISAVNAVAHGEIRALPYLHWWSFLGYYMEIRESLYSTVLEIRRKKQQHKKLEKYEEEFYRNNRKLIDLKRAETAEERAAKNELRKLLGMKEK